MLIAWLCLIDAEGLPDFASTAALPADGQVDACRSAGGHTLHWLHLPFQYCESLITTPGGPRAKEAQIMTKADKRQLRDSSFNWPTLQPLDRPVGNIHMGLSMFMQST